MMNKLRVLNLICTDWFLGTLGNNRFRDTHCRVVGQAAMDVQEVFLHSMMAASFAVWKQMEEVYRKQVTLTGRDMYDFFRSFFIYFYFIYLFIHLYFIYLIIII
jgi:hypothetical protein